MSAFIEAFNAGSERWIAFGTAMALQTCLLFALLFALDLLLRRRVRAALRHAFWLLFLIKLLVPPSWSFPTGAGYWLGGQAWASAPSAAVSRAAAAGRPASGAEVVSITQAPGAGAETFAVAPRSRPSLRPAAWLALAWLMGVVGLLACFLRRVVQLRAVVARSVPAPDAVQTLLDGCRAQFGWRGSVRVRLSEDVRSPALCGLLRPVVLLPLGLADTLVPARLRAVLFHELVHLQRGDLWIQLWQTLLQIVYWWHPLVWAANVRIRIAREEAVDDRVMRELGGDLYPATLLELAKGAIALRWAGLSLVGVLDSGGLSRRIRRLLEMAPPVRPRLGWSGVLWTVLLGAMVVPMRAQVRVPAPLVEQKAARQEERAEADAAPKVVAAVYDALYDPQRGSRQPKPILGQAEVEAVVGPVDGSKALTLDQAEKILRTAAYVPGSIIGLDQWFVETYGKNGGLMIENASLVMAGRSSSLHGVVDFYEPPVVDRARRDELNPLARERERLKELTLRFTSDNPQVIKQLQRVAELEARFRTRAFRVDAALFLRNLELRRGETIRAASDDPMEVFLDLLKGAGVDCAPNQYFFNRETGTIVLWNTAEGLAAAERVILGLNQPDGRASSYAPPAGTNPSILAEATIMQSTDAAFTRLRLGTPISAAQQIGDSWHLSPEDWQTIKNRTRAEGMAIVTRPRIQTSPGVTARMFVGLPPSNASAQSVTVELVPYLTQEQVEMTVLVQTTGYFSPNKPADWPDQEGWTNIALHGRITLKEGEGVVMRARHSGPNPTNNLVVLLSARLMP